MINKAKNDPSYALVCGHKEEDELRIVIESNADDTFNVHMYRKDVLEIVMPNVQHFQVTSPFGSDAM